MPDPDSAGQMLEDLPVPISLTRRAGDFVFVSGLGDHYFTPEDVTFNPDGSVLDGGAGLGSRSIEQQTRSIFERIAAALGTEDCALSNIVEMTVWLKDPRDFIGFNETYKAFFSPPQPTRAIVRADFMFDVLVEVKITAYKPRAPD